MAFATLGYEMMSNIGLSEGGMALRPEKARTKRINAGVSHRQGGKGWFVHISRSQMSYKLTIFL
jgi:hypothetical protein